MTRSAPYPVVHGRSKRSAKRSPLERPQAHFEAFLGGDRPRNTGKKLRFLFSSAELATKRIKTITSPKTKSPSALAR
jgi:hypothetical protein